MLTEEQRESLTPAVRAMQIIAGALVMGVLAAGVVFIFMTFGKKQPIPNPFLTYLAAGWGAIAIVLSFVVPGVMGGNMRRNSNASPPLSSGNVPPVGPLVGRYQTLLIIRLAMLEGAAFFAIFAYFLEANLISLGVAGVLLLVMLASFPTVSRVENWIEDEVRLIEEQFIR
jgi:hypothetical protein